MKRFLAAVITLAFIASPSAVWANGENGNGNGPPHRTNIRIRNQNTNRNTNRNTNLNLNLNKNSNRNYNTNVNVNKLENKQYQGQEQYQGQHQGQIGINVQKDKNKQTVNIEGDDYPVSTATGPALTSGNDTCMGSTSIGGQGMSFGFSLGTTWIDRNCIRLKNANALHRLGHTKAALALLAIDDDVAAALKAAGVAYISLEKVIEKREHVAAVEAAGRNGVVKAGYYGIDPESGLPVN